MRNLIFSVCLALLVSSALSQGPTVKRTPSALFTQSATFTFTITGTSSDTAFSQYGCQVDNGGRVPCPSGTFTQSQPLTEGKHSFTAYYYNPGTSAYKDPTTISWTVDQTSPSLQFINNIDGQKKKDKKLTVDYRVNSNENMGTYTCVLMRLTVPLNTTILCSGKGTTTGSATLDNLVIAGREIQYKFVVTATDSALNKATQSMTFIIDDRLPIVMMPVLGASALPDRYTQANQSAFTFEADETGVTFTCQLGSAPAVSCAGDRLKPHTYGNDQTPQAEGDYIFYLVATDEAGNQQSQFLVKNSDGTSTARMSYIWTVDRTPPNRPDIILQPSSPSSDPNPRFRFVPPVAEIGGVTYVCEIKRPSSSFATFPCTSDSLLATPTSVVPGAINGKLGTGPHSLRVRMKDAAGNIGQYNEFNWIIDLVPPIIYNATNFATSPDSLTKSPDKTFRFYSSDDYVVQTDQMFNSFETRTRNPCPSVYCTYECKLDALPWGVCGSPQSVTDIVDKGFRETHTFYARAVDDAGNRGTPTSFTWEIDRVDVTVLWLQQPDIIDNHESETFIWATTENFKDEPPTFMCEVDVRGAVPCGATYDKNGRYNFTATGLTHGHHDFYLTAIDYVGNVAPRIKYSWTTDLNAPVVNHVTDWGPGTPTNPYTNNPTVKFVFSTEAHATLWCRLDAGNVTVEAYSKCSARASTVFNEVNTYVYTGLPDDQYIFYAISIDQGGNISPNVSYQFIVDTVGPNVSFATRPNRYTNKLTALFVLNSSEIMSSFECQYISDRYQDIKTKWLPCHVQPFFARQLDSWGAVQFSVDQFKDQAGNRIIYIDKPHEMRARATDLSGNTGPATSWVWEIDLIPPTLNFSASDNDVANQIVNPNFRWVNKKSVVLDFAASDSTYKCFIQRYDWASSAYVNVTTVDCTPPYTFTNYSGLFRVKVKAYDYFGNSDKISENDDEYVIGIVGSGPSSRIISGPVDVAISLISKFTVVIPVPRARANCSVRRQLQSKAERSWQCVPADSNQGTKDIPGAQQITFDVSKYVTGESGKYDGKYVFSYTVVDSWNNVSPERRYTWSIDVSPPKTAISGSTPEFTQQTSISFWFFADEPTIDRFECKLNRVLLGRLSERRCTDGDLTNECPFRPCNYTYGYQGNASYWNLKDDIYEFSVRAIDIGGNIDKSPATVRFTVDTQRPPVTFLGAFPEVNTSIYDNVKIYFKGDLGSQFFCRIREQFGQQNSDQNSQICQSPYIVPAATVPVLDDGTYNLIVDVMAVDKAGNDYTASVEVLQGAGRYYPSYTNRLEEHKNKTLNHLPKTCDNYDDTFAAVAIAGFALFAILAVVFPLVIMSRMASSSPSKLNQQSQRSREGVSAFTRRPLEEDFY